MLFSENKSPKLASPTTQRRPISIIITPESGSVTTPASTPVGDRPRSGSLSPRTSSNIDVEEDEAVLKKRAQVCSFQNVSYTMVRIS